MNNLLRLHQGVASLVEDDPWTLVREGEATVGALILPLDSWLLRRAQRPEETHAVWLGPDDEVEGLRPWLAQIPLIAVDFPSFRDGRGYSQAYLLRTRLAGRASCARLAMCCAIN